ncbi:histone-lysine N-methyltransferase ASHR3-like isoform X2 [Nicotiana tabacum]|uniref:Histone-lysine N-methyltransferase ASHR3-like isoform X2 n=2 Tax=Nicotiana TaxID=4085 RepID=A0A1S3ZW55_TOBAC|nr:PREDICTED: histone-lysine N-methyltransferase ASHR3 isoform X2 [Nicotiana sylvestris]XP_016468660.1 PREDICTED: histone-lysine N-methyltransferase ASHR3-like isoform X2 [Nicotiana tabacum]
MVLKMPDFGNLLDPNIEISSESDSQIQALVVSDPNTQMGFPILHKEDELKLENRGLRQYGGGSVAKKSLDDYVKDWVQRKVNAGVDKNNCFLPFLVHAPKLVECSVCQRLIFPGEKVGCSVRDCTGVFHLKCAKERLGLSSPKTFKCPQHVCYVCNKKIHLWRCIRCPLASHDKCAAFPEHVVHLNDQPGRVICWKHSADWHLEKEIFNHLPLPYMEEEFKIDINWKDMIENRFEPPPYVHIKRNVYLIKKKRDGINADIGCTNCRSTECSDNCVCRVQCISCSKACRCSDMCSNRPFRREKKIKVVKTELCGWGVVAAESIKKGDFIIEYIGEVIDDALCEKRLWDMKYKGVKNFYMCELRKDFTIDATFKGNLSRFLNHSCDPNCKLEKWQVEGETRVGVFAAQSIEVGEPLTYDYRFVQFGPEVKCNCGASNCQGYLGSKKKIVTTLDICWGTKRRRTSTSCLAIIKLNTC